MRTWLVVTLMVVGLLVPAGGFGLARWLLGEDDYVLPPKPKPVHVGISSSDVTLPDTLEGGALVHDSAGMRPEGAEIWLYKAPGFIEQLALSIDSDGQPTLDSVLNQVGSSIRERTIVCQYSDHNNDIMCNALLDDGRLFANFTELTTAGSPVSHPKDLREAMRRTEDYLAEAQR